MDLAVDAPECVRITEVAGKAYKNSTPNLQQLKFKCIFMKLLLPSNRMLICAYFTRTVERERSMQ
jgi:hypothetical protein